MMAIRALVISLLLLSSSCAGDPGSQYAHEPVKTDLFVGGQDGYAGYRIPALLVTEGETVLAFCEGRKTGLGDAGDIDLLLRRSADGGISWATMEVVHEEGDTASVTIGNPCVVFDERSRRVLLMYSRNNKRFFLKTADARGQNWTTAVELSHLMADFDFSALRIGTGPGHGIVMQNGRIVMPVWLSDREPHLDGAPPRYRSGTVYSDDRGKTWRAGGLVPPALASLNEATVAECRDGSLLINMRAQGAGARAISRSEDGGLTWQTPELDPQLPCPTCQASLLATREGVLYFSNPAMSSEAAYDKAKRRRLTLRRSLDDGKSWTGFVLEPGFAGYSDLALLSDSMLLCLYERGAAAYNEKLTFARIPTAVMSGRFSDEEVK